MAFRAELAEWLAERPEEWELLFVDEATVRRHATSTAQWCLADEVPEVPCVARQMAQGLDGHMYFAAPFAFRAIIAGAVATFRTGL